MSGEEYKGDKRRYMDAKDFRYVSEPKVVVDKGLTEGVVKNVGGGSPENCARVIDPEEIAGAISADEERLAEERAKIGGGSPEVHARGFEAPTSEQVYEAEANKHRDEMLRQDAAEQENKPKGFLNKILRIIRPRQRLG